MTLPEFIPQKLFYRPSEVAEYIGQSKSTVLRLMAEGAFGRLKPWGGTDEKPYYKITYHSLLKFYQDGEDPLKN